MAHCGHRTTPRRRLLLLTRRCRASARRRRSGPKVRSGMAKGRPTTIDKEGHVRSEFALDCARARISRLFAVRAGGDAWNAAGYTLENREWSGRSLERSRRSLVVSTELSARFFL